MNVNKRVPTTKLSTKTITGSQYDLTIIDIPVLYSTLGWNDQISRWFILYILYWKEELSIIKYKVKCMLYCKIIRCQPEFLLLSQSKTKVVKMFLLLSVESGTYVTFFYGVLDVKRNISQTGNVQSILVIYCGCHQLIDYSNITLNAEDMSDVKAAG